MQLQTSYMHLIVLVVVPLLLVGYVLWRVWLKGRARKTDRGFEIIPRAEKDANEGIDHG